MSTSPTPAYRPRCLYLMCKSMAVYGEDFQQDPEFQAGLVEFQCLRTFRHVGPDGEELSLERCSDPQRSCYQEY
jgi:hypothetical protein